MGEMGPMNVVIGLIVFVTVQSLNLIGLLFDLWLWCNGHSTITQHVWNTPIYGLPIILLQVIGLIGLIVHFYGNIK